MIVNCPRCGKECETSGNPYRPFCGERCKLLDLGNWLDEAYRIPEENSPDDAMEPVSEASSLKGGESA